MDFINVSKSKLSSQIYKTWTNMFQNSKDLPQNAKLLIESNFNTLVKEVSWTKYPKRQKGKNFFYYHNW